MPYTKDRIIVPVTASAAPKAVWFGALGPHNHRTWSIKASQHPPYANPFGPVFGEVDGNGAFGCLAHDDNRTALGRAEIAQTLSHLLLATEWESCVITDGNAVSPIALIRSAHPHSSRAKSVVVLAEPWAALMPRMSYDATTLPVCWVFTTYNAETNCLEFDFIEWTYDDVATECAIAEVYRPDLTPCDTCSINGIVCKRRHVKKMFVASDLPEAIKKVASKAENRINSHDKSIWERVFYAFRARVPVSAAHLTDRWLGPNVDMSVHVTVNDKGASVFISDAHNLVDTRKANKEAAAKAVATSRKRENMCSNCVLHKTCTLYRHSSTCISFRTSHDLTEYVVHNDESMRPDDALLSLLTTTFSAKATSRLDLPPDAGRRLTKRVLLDGIDLAGKWCARLMAVSKRRQNPGVGDNKQLRFDTYEEMCLWLDSVHPEMWADYKEFLKGDTATHIRKYFNYSDAVRTMGAGSRGEMYSTNIAVYVSNAFSSGAPPRLLLQNAGRSPDDYLDSNLWWTSFRNARRPSQWGAELPAGAERVTFTA